MTDKTQPSQQLNIVTITRGRSKERYETWRYWEIVGALRWAGTEITESYEAARWAARAKPGETRQVGEIKMEVNGNGL